MSLSKTPYPLLSIGSRQEQFPDMTGKLLTGMYSIAIFLQVKTGGGV